jgi:outer membrane protein assembly factor BamB
VNRYLLSAGLTLALALTLAAADWAQFKGPNATGVSAEKNLPAEWGKDKGVKWKAALPARGVSSPVVFGDRVYVTCSGGIRDDKLHVLCFDANTGKQLWHRQMKATGGTTAHPKSCMAAPTPAADETGVYALFATGDLAAYEPDGTLRWYRSLVGDYPDVTNQVGMAASPIIVKDKLIVPMDNAGESFLAALDTKYGKNVWKVERPRDINWVTPLVRNVGSATEVLFDSPSGLAAYDANTGEKRWSSKLSSGSIPTGVLLGDTLYTPSGGVTAIKLGAKGPEGEPVMKAKDVKAGMPSPLVYLGKVYAVTNQGIISCADAKTGKTLYTERAKGGFSASPVAGDGKVYFLNETGACLVIDGKANEFELLATNELGGETLGTPAIANWRIYIRTAKEIYAIGK